MEEDRTQPESALQRHLEQDQLADQLAVAHTQAVPRVEQDLIRPVEELDRTEIAAFRLRWLLKCAK